MLNLITVYRYISLTSPFNITIKSKSLLYKRVGLGVIISTIVPALFLVIYQFVERNEMMPLQTCMLFGETKRSVTIKVATIFISLLQIISSFVITIINLLLIKELTKTSDNSFKSTVQRNSPKITAKILFFTFSNAVCWLPSSAIYIASVAMETFPTDLLVWNSVLINPINSVINAFVLLLIPAVKKMLKPWMTTRGTG